MPQQKEKAGDIKRTVQSKFRVGTRDSGKSAHSMSNTELLAVLERKDNAKYHNNVRAVLRRRGVLIRPAIVLD